MFNISFSMFITILKFCRKLQPWEYVKKYFLGFTLSTGSFELFLVGTRWFFTKINYIPIDSSEAQFKSIEKKILLKILNKISKNLAFASRLSYFFIYLLIQYYFLLLA